MAERNDAEYKREYTAAFLKTVSAYANYGDGRIFFGVDDDGTTVGVRDATELKLQIENAVNDNIFPRPFYDLAERVEDGKMIVVLTVRQGEDTPYLYKSKAYRRMNTATTPVDKDALIRLHMKGSNSGYDEWPAEPAALTFDLLALRLKERLRLTRADADIFKTLGLIKGDKYTVAATLLSDNGPIEASQIEMARFGDSLSIIIERQGISNLSLIKQYELAMDFFKKAYPPTERIEGEYRRSIEKIPLVAFREAIANAIVHRDYSLKSGIRIELHPSRAEVVSPGGLPPEVSEQEYREGRISSPRNRIIAEVFHRLGIVEKFATGIRRIHELYANTQASPEFIVRDNSITVILPVLEDTGAPVPPGQTKGENHDERLLQHLRRQGFITRSEVEKLTGLKQTQAKKLLRRLEETGKIKRAGTGRATRYTSP